MFSTTPTVFVLSATGSQGGAVARQLLELNWHVHATVRSLESPAAKALEALGAQLTQGEWDNDGALSAAMTGCDKLFLCLLPAQGDSDLERRRAENIVKIARAAGVKQVVASSSLGVSMYDKNEHVNSGSFFEKHIASKKGVEQAVADGGFEHWTLLRPSLFMANFLEPKINRPGYVDVRDKGCWTTPVTAETNIALVDHEDIAKLAVSAFQNPVRFHGQAIGVASELITPQEIMKTLGEAAGKTFNAAFLTDDQIAAQGINSQVWMRFMSDYVDLKQLRTMVPLTTFKQFLEREKETVRATYK
ncbi:hypothetical protein DL770_008639 [Monosporascus sp. CRB-9-2]|nr:hypothetical protein DL770_008639 [Monosporascus sp. CRB-9-2]